MSELHKKLLPFPHADSNYKKTHRSRLGLELLHKMIARKTPELQLQFDKSQHHRRPAKSQSAAPLNQQEVLFIVVISHPQS